MCYRSAVKLLLLISLEMTRNISVNLSKDMKTHAQSYHKTVRYSIPRIC